MNAEIGNRIEVDVTAQSPVRPAAPPIMPTPALRPALRDVGQAARPSGDKKRLIVASAFDRPLLEPSPLAEITDFIAGDQIAGSVIHDSFPLLAVALSERGEDDVKRALDAMRDMRTLPDIRIIRLVPDTLDAAADLIRDVLEFSVLRLADYTASLTSELSMVRREREALFENFRALEDTFRARDWEPVTDVFSHDPFDDPKEEGIAHLIRESAVEQLFPVSSYAVSGFALHFRTVSKEQGALMVALEIVESGETVAEWTMPYSALSADWNYFALHKACDSNPRSLRLRLRADGGVPPDPSLGHPVLNSRYAVRAQEAQRALGHKPLALKIFTGLPGVRPTYCPSTFVPDTVAPQSGGAARWGDASPTGRSTKTRARTADYLLGPNVLVAVNNVSAFPVEPDFQTIDFLPEENAIVCHPVVGGLTAGGLNGVVASGTRRLSARAKIDHPEGQPAAVGLLLVPSAMDPQSVIADLARSGEVAPSAIFGGWRPVTSQQPANLNLLFKTPIAEPMSLVVMSRAVEQSVDFSWLKFFDLRLEGTPEDVA